MTPAAEISQSAAPLSDMTKAQLLAYAGEHGVTGVSSRNNKAEIAKAIEEAGA